jgi:hypothetical protein
MAFRFRYKLLSAKQAVVPLGGRWVRPRPLALVSLVGPTDTYVQYGLLDTGADDTVFPEWVATKIGVDLAFAPTGDVTGVGMDPLPVRYAQATIRVAHGGEQREWPAWVGFTAARLQRPLLGFAGFLQFFTATYHGDHEEVKLAVNALYPGT